MCPNFTENNDFTNLGACGEYWHSSLPLSLLTIPFLSSLLFNGLEGMRGTEQKQQQV